MKDKLAVTKRMLWDYIRKKLNHSIHHNHTYSVLSILFEEIYQDFKDGKELRIANFGIIQLKDTPPRRYWNVVYQKMMQSKGKKILRFELFTKISKKIISYLDVDKTFSED